MPNDALNPLRDPSAGARAYGGTPAEPSRLDRTLATPPADESALPPVEPPPQPQGRRRGAVLQSEYVSGGGYIFLASYIRSLPQWIDDTTRDLGDDLYERMLLDPQVSAAIRLLKLAALDNGVRLEPAVDLENMEADAGDPEAVSTDNQPRDRYGNWRTRTDQEMFEVEKDRERDRRLDRIKVEARLAAEVCDFCQENLENLERPFMDVLYEMLDAVALGNRVAEQVYDMSKDREGRQRLHLKMLKVKPRGSTAFVVDAFLNCLGLVGIIPGRGYPVTSGTVIATPDKVPNLLPREKFAVLTWAAPNNDPRGSSILRSVYNPWWLKMQTLGEYVKYLAQFAGPSLVGYTAPGAVPVPQTDSMGNVIPGGSLITPEQAMMTALLGFKNSSVIALPNGAQLDPITAQGNGEAFKDAITKFNGEISKGILCQTLATEEGVHMAKAASETHQDVLDMVINHVRQTVGRMIRKDILLPLVRYNWGEDVARHLTPKVFLSQTQQHNWAQDASALSSLAQSGYLDPSQYRELDARLGLPKRKPGVKPQQPAGGKGGPGGAPGGGAPGAPGGGAPGMPG